MKASFSIALVVSLVTVHGLAVAAPQIASSAKITVSNNKASNVMAQGGSAKAKAAGGLGASGSMKMTGEANVNSLVVNGGGVAGKVTISGNEAKDIKAIGGAANVNSVIVNQ